jgi:hypothetical protein
LRSILGAASWPHTYNSSSASARVIGKILRINRNAADSDRYTGVGASDF